MLLPSPATIQSQSQLVVLVVVVVVAKEADVEKENVWQEWKVRTRTRLMASMLGFLVLLVHGAILKSFPRKSRGLRWGEWEQLGRRTFTLPPTLGILTRTRPQHHPTGRRWSKGEQAGRAIRGGPPHLPHRNSRGG